jgi:hypothetical protein
VLDATNQVGNTIIWGPFGEREWSECGPRTEEEGGIDDDDHHFKQISDQTGYPLTYVNKISGDIP